MGKRNKRGTVVGSDYEVLFADGVSDAGAPGPGWIRTKTIKAGDMLSVESCPVIVNPDLRRRRETEKKRLRTSPAQERVNEEHSRKRFTALLETNFGLGDVLVTNTYDYGIFDYGMSCMKDVQAYRSTDELPESFEDANRDKNNFIKRVKNAITRLGGKAKDLKYMWVIEAGKEPNDLDPNPTPRKYHMHIVMSHPLIKSRIITREMLENIWGLGFTRCENLKFDNNGLARLGKYMTKQRRYNRRWGRSRNLKEPVVTVSNYKMSMRRSERIAADVRANAAEIYAKLYPGYVLAEQPIIKYSLFIGGAYIYARLRKKPPYVGGQFH